MPISRIETASLDSALVAPTATALTTASGSAPSYSARAWVNFNGTGTVAIRGSGNVSSITDGGVGLYTVNLTTAMPDANYCVTTTMSTNASNNRDVGAVYNLQTSNFQVATYQVGGALEDYALVCASIFR